MSTTGSSRTAPGRQLSSLHLLKRKLFKQCRTGSVTSLSETIASLAALQPDTPLPALFSSLRTPADETALHVVISSHPSPVPLVDHLLARGHSPSVRGHSQHLRAVLHEAARRGDEFGPPCVRLLLRHNAPVNAVKSGDWTPLMLAALAGTPGTVKLLLDASARVDLRNKEGATAAHLAAKADCVQTLTLILDAAGEAVHWRTRNGRTPLHYAARSGSQQCIGLLQRRAANTRATDKAGMCAAHEAAAQGEDGALRMLMANRAGQEAARRGDVGGLNVLHHAAVSGGVKVANVAMQLDHELELEAEDARGQTAMFLALWHTKTALVDLLRGKGAAVDRIWIGRFRQAGREKSATLTEELLNTEA